MGGSVVLKIAFVVSGLALLFHILGYSTDSWQVTKLGGSVISESGLWNTCETVIQRRCKSNEMGGNLAVDDEMKTVRAFSTIAFIMLISVTVAIFLSLCIAFLRGKLFIFLQMATAIAAGVLILIAVIVYGTTIIPSNPPAEVSWSLGLSVIGAGLAITAGILVAVGGCLEKGDKK